MRDLKLDPKELKVLLEKKNVASLASWCLFCGATKGAEALMPTQFRQVGFENIKEMVASGVMSDLMTQIPDKMKVANWCLFCGASSGTKATDLGRPVELTDENVEELANDILGLVKTE
ncbi:MAG: hypothetical protein SCH70_12675 [Candidatus Methanoperedens sp.]|nr:hypothetical protein [Candidatus Methanoperedens sp.]